MGKKRKETLYTRIFSSEGVTLGLIFSSMVWFLNFAVDSKVVHAELQTQTVSTQQFNKLITETIPSINIQMERIETNQGHMLKTQDAILKVLERR